MLLFFIITMKPKKIALSPLAESTYSLPCRLQGEGTLSVRMWFGLDGNVAPYDNVNIVTCAAGKMRNADFGRGTLENKL